MVEHSGRVNNEINLIGEIESVEEVDEELDDHRVQDWYQDFQASRQRADPSPAAAAAAAAADAAITLASRQRADPSPAAAADAAITLQAQQQQQHQQQ